MVLGRNTLIELHHSLSIFLKLLIINFSAHDIYEKWLKKFRLKCKINIFCIFLAFCSISFAVYFYTSNMGNAVLSIIDALTYAQFGMSLLSAFFLHYFLSVFQLIVNIVFEKLPANLENFDYLLEYSNKFILNNGKNSNKECKPKEFVHFQRDDILKVLMSYHSLEEQVSKKKHFQINNCQI